MGIQTLFTYPNLFKDNGEENVLYDKQVRKFKVPKRWLEMLLENKVEMSLQEFVDTYDYDGALYVYNEAYAAGVIIEDRIIQ